MCVGCFSGLQQSSVPFVFLVSCFFVCIVKMEKTPDANLQCAMRALLALQEKTPDANVECALRALQNFQVVGDCIDLTDDVETPVKPEIVKPERGAVKSQVAENLFNAVKSQDVKSEQCLDAVKSQVTKSQQCAKTVGLQTVKPEHCSQHVANSQVAQPKPNPEHLVKSNKRILKKTGLQAVACIQPSAEIVCIDALVDQDLLALMRSGATPQRLVREGHDMKAVWLVARELGVKCKGNWFGKRDSDDPSRCKFCKDIWSSGDVELRETAPRVDYSLVCSNCDAASRQRSLRAEAEILSLDASDFQLFLQESKEKKAKRIQRLQKAKARKDAEDAELRKRRRRGDHK